MSDYSNFKTSLENNKKISLQMLQASNPLAATISDNSVVLTDYSKEISRPKYDKDILDIIEVVKILNNLAPIRMPIYNFNLNEINGEHFYRPDGTLLLVREYDGDLIRDYYVGKTENPEITISRILEHDKNSGRLRAKIEPITRKGSRLNTNITIFDEKINKKYTIIQLSDDGIVNNISEFTGKGKSFQTLFRNIYTRKPARYLEGKDTENGFEMVDCIFDAEGQIARIKRYSNKKEINIDYTKDKKNVSVKTKLE